MPQRKQVHAPKLQPSAKRSPRGAVADVAQSEGPAPKLPHERDQSTGATAGPPRKRMQQAKQDLDRGLQDTDRGPAMDETYHKLKKTP